MKRYRRGFTLVEVSLFLAITAAIFVSIAVGTQNSIFQQRYNDSVQNFVEFLRSVYSQVSNVQSEGTGRTDKAIYGKLVVFGEADGQNAITTYNVVGNIDDESSSGDILTRLGGLGANVVIKDSDDSFKTVGFVDNYKPRWAAQIQTDAGWDDGYQLFEGMLLVVRHPGSGTIYTFFDKDNVINVEEMIAKAEMSKTIDPLIGSKDFKKEDVVFCVNPNGPDQSNLRRGVKIAKGARNASGIEILSDGERCSP